MSYPVVPSGKQSWPCIDYLSFFSLLYHYPYSPGGACRLATAGTQSQQIVSGSVKVNRSIARYFDGKRPSFAVLGKGSGRIYNLSR
jgi:hypothetical protein